MSTFLSGVSGECYISAEYQGRYRTQEAAEFANGEPRVRYAEVAVEADGIPIFGSCHRRMGGAGATVILKER